MHYHPETNGPRERFNQMFIDVIGKLESDEKQHWRDYLSTLVHAYNCTRNNATYLNPII